MFSPLDVLSFCPGANEEKVFRGACHLYAVGGSGCSEDDVSTHGAESLLKGKNDILNSNQDAAVFEKAHCREVAQPSGQQGGSSLGSLSPPMPGSPGVWSASASHSSDDAFINMNNEVDTEFQHNFCASGTPCSIVKQPVLQAELLVPPSSVDTHLKLTKNDGSCASMESGNQRKRPSIEQLPLKVGKFHRTACAPVVSQSPYISLRSGCLGCDEERSVDSVSSRENAPPVLIPFHVNDARSYYTELEVVPPYTNYAIQSPRGSSNQRWCVTLGDAVAVHCVGCSNRHDIFKVPWAYAEIITIWKCRKPPEAKFMIELRWFYRDHEIPGASGPFRSLGQCYEPENIIESDVVDECEASCLLAPVALHEAAMSNQTSPMELVGGVPVVHAYCSNIMYVVKRKSAMTTSGMSGRVLRGRNYSNHFDKRGVLNAALTRFCQEGNKRGDAHGHNADLNGCDELGNDPHNVSPPGKLEQWHASLKEVIQSLNLASAFIDASVVEGNPPLTGRETQLEQIVGFLRTRIEAAADCMTDVDGNMGSQPLLLGGPPGTGKTASLHTAIAFLQGEVSNQKLPAFHFMSLNCFELRTPEHLYVNFWKEIPDSRNEVCSHPSMALSNIQRYFGTEQCYSNANQDGIPIIHVVGVEEICTLLRDQKILYNLFNLPDIAQTHSRTPKLIIVGIANTRTFHKQLKTNIASRVGDRNQCFFSSYKSHEISAILTKRIESKRVKVIKKKRRCLFLHCLL